MTRDEIVKNKANLTGANLYGADLTGADLTGADLTRADLSGADLSGVNLNGRLIQTMKIFSGLYAYQVWVVHFQDETFWIRMGCLFKSIEEWKQIGILDSNPSEFPNNGSSISCERERAFNFALETAKAMGATL